MSIPHLVYLDDRKPVCLRPERLHVAAVTLNDHKDVNKETCPACLTTLMRFNGRQYAETGSVNGTVGTPKRVMIKPPNYVGCLVIFGLGALFWLLVTFLLIWVLS